MERTKKIRRNLCFRYFFAWFFLFSVFNQGNTLDKNWTVFHSNNSVTMYYKKNSVKGKGVKTVHVMLDFVKNQISPAGKQIRSIRMIQNYDCAGSRVRLKSAINFSDSLLKGTEVARGNETTPWQSIPNGTPYKKLLNMLCK